MRLSAAWAALEDGLISAINCPRTCSVTDPRVEALADILVQHSTEVGPGDLVVIDGTANAQPLLMACYRRVLAAGGHPRLNVGFEEAQEVYLSEANDDQLEFLDPIAKFQADSIQAAIRIRATENTRALANVDPSRLAKTMIARRPVMDQIIENVRWVLCDYPTNALAQEAEMSLGEYADFLYGATNIDWSEMTARLASLKTRLEAGSDVRIIGPDTDLTLRTAGRIWEPADGKKNMPDGEIFTAPIEDSVNGRITYDFPAIYQGRQVDGITLTFKDGLIVEATAERGEEFLNAILDTDSGARRLGEIGIGTNNGIQRHTKNILFDEKMGGTVHLAVGRAYEFTGGKNQSAVHWDMVKDLRTDAALYLDGELLQENGVFVE
ncbi:MAG: aminopeptidase [Chloroflexi bacterium]|nr:aminopeptidase [Chloroflexota bacterium]